MYFERENNKSFMVVEEDKIVQHSYELKMIEKNNIPRLLPVQLRNINGKSVYYYDITSKQQFTKLFSYAGIKWDDLQMVCEGLSLLAKDINEYMLNMDDVILSPEYIYVDVSDRAIYFTYCDSEKIKVSKDIHLQLKTLFEYILEKFDNSDKTHLMKMYSVYQKIAQEEYDINNMCELLQMDSIFEQPGSEIPKVNNTRNEDVKRIKIDAVRPEIIEEEEEVENKTAKKAEGYLKAVAVFTVLIGVVSLIMPEILPIRINSLLSITMVVLGVFAYILLPRIFSSVRFNIETSKVEQEFELESECSDAVEDCATINDSSIDNVSFNADNNTVLLSDYLRQLQEKERGVLKLVPLADEGDGVIEVKKYPAIIGSMSERCDNVINNPLISRMHMCILKERDGYCVEDMNTTNGTYINQERLSPNVRKRIINGDEIKLATLSYKVEIG